MLISQLIKDQKHPHFFPKNTQGLTDSFSVMLSNMMSKIANINNEIQAIVKKLGSISLKIKDSAENLILFRDTVSSNIASILNMLGHQAIL
jgi:hypothetical protein